jgi:hypothetical protein
MNEALLVVLTHKIGLTDDQANKVVQTSEKHAIWIANQLKSFGNKVPKTFWSNTKVIIAWVKKNQTINLKTLTYKEALLKAKKSDKAPFKFIDGSLKNAVVFADCEGSPYKWVELKTKDDCHEEGKAMKNCLKDNLGGGYIFGGSSFKENKLFSLRNEFNRPVVTLCLRATGRKDNPTFEVADYLSKTNSEPKKEYAKYFKFLEAKVTTPITANSKYELGLSDEMTMELFHEQLSAEIEDYRNGEVSIEYGTKQIQRLIECAIKSNLKVDISPNLLDFEEVYEQEESLEYDDDGSLIC